MSYFLWPVRSGRVLRGASPIFGGPIWTAFEKVRTVVKLIRQKQHHLLVLLPGLKPGDLTALFPHAQWYGDWATLKAALLTHHGEGPVTVAVYRCAPFLIPSGALEPQAIKAESRHPQRLPAST